MSKKSKRYRGGAGAGAGISGGDPGAGACGDKVAGRPSGRLSPHLPQISASCSLHTSTLSKKSLPEPFLEMLISAVGSELASQIKTAILETPPVISIRINPAKWPNLVAADHPLTSSEPLTGEAAINQVPWCPTGRYLTERPNFTLDPAFHSGAYYVQEPSSMIIEILRPIVSQANSVLDLCAAPGGKSTHLATMIGGGAAAGGETAWATAAGISSGDPGSSASARPAFGRPAARLTANEIIRSRAATLRENISKWGDPRVTVTSLDPSAFAKRGEEFDFILVDAPCSGEGMFRKDPDSILEWSPRAVEECVARQRKIVKDIWETLEPGGHLAYSTCTMNLHENEENVQWFAQTLGAHIIPLDTYLQASLPSHLQTLSDTLPSDKLPSDTLLQLQPLPEQSLDHGIIITPEGALRLHPGLVKGEGLFLALLRKPDSQSGSTSPSNKIITATSKSSKNRSLTNNSTSYSTKNLASTKNAKLNSFLPDHYNALSLEYNGHYPSVELSREMAIKYLSRETLSLPDSPVGYLRVTYCGLGLGFVKNIGSRANNLLPTSLRILKPGKL